MKGNNLGLIRRDYIYQSCSTA